MAVGTTPLTFYQGENIKPRFQVTDPNVTDITGWTVSFVIKALASDDDPPLHSANATIVDGPGRTLDVATLLPLTLVPGTYVYSLRRTNTGFDWQLAHAPLIILDSAHKDIPFP